MHTTHATAYLIHEYGLAFTTYSDGSRISQTGGGGKRQLQGGGTNL